MHNYRYIDKFKKVKPHQFILLKRKKASMANASEVTEDHTKTTGTSLFKNHIGKMGTS